MRLGLVYDLRDDYRGLGLSEEALAEFDSPETIDALEAALVRAGHECERIGNVRRLCERLVKGARWDLVFNVAEGLLGRSREAQVPAVLEAFDQPYVFSDPLTMAVSLDKSVAKRVVRDAGVPTPAFAVLERAEDAAWVDVTFPAFVKPLAEGTGKGCEAASKVLDTRGLARSASRLITRFSQPVIVESFLPGREFTVGIVGTGATATVVGIMEIELVQSADYDVYSFVNKEECESRVRYHAATDPEALRAADVALEAYRVLGCRDAGRVDLRSDALGSPHFLELNPLAGLHPAHSDLPILAGLCGLDYDGLLSQIIDAASRRYRLGSTEAGRPGARVSDADGAQRCS